MFRSNGTTSRTHYLGYELVINKKAHTARVEQAGRVVAIAPSFIRDLTAWARAAARVDSATE